MPIKSVKMRILKNKKMRVFLISQESLNRNIRFLGQKVCSVTRAQTYTKVRTEEEDAFYFANNLDGVCLNKVVQDK